MVIMLQTKVKRDCSSSATHRLYLESKPVLTVIKETKLDWKGKRTDRSMPIWAIWATAAASILERERERERTGHSEPELETDKGRHYVGENHKLTSVARWLSHFLSSLKPSPSRSSPITDNYSILGLAWSRVPSITHSAVFLPRG